MGREIHSEEDRVLRFAVKAVIVLFVTGALFIALRMMNPRVDASAGQEKLEQLEKADVKKIDAKIQKMEEAERAADEERQSRPMNERFAGCLILGDSITQGLYEFGVLDASLVLAERGVVVHDADGTGLTELLNKAVSANPQKLFLAVGMNDILSERGDAKAFQQDYEKVLDKLTEALPDTTVYVNSILPASSTVVEKEDQYANVSEYNEKLEKLCEKAGAVFIDNTELVKEEYYGEDGIHVSPAYYGGWVAHMAEVAGL